MKNSIKFLKNEKGATFIEIMLSVALISIIVTPLLGAVMSSVNNNAVSRDRAVAMALADTVMGEIKARKSIGPTSEVDAIPYPTSTGGNLKAYYKIVQEIEGRVAPSDDSDKGAYTYMVPHNKSFDLELVINQGSDTSDKELDYIELYQIDNSTGEREQPSKKLEKFKVNNSFLELNIIPSFMTYGIQKKEFTSTGTEPFSNGTFSDASQIKLKVTNETTNPSNEEQLIIHTNLLSDIDLKVFVFNTELDNSGVNFINIGKTKFEVNYVDSNEFAYNEPLNQLFKVDVIIEDTSQKVIYQTTSYVKK